MQKSLHVYPQNNPFSSTFPAADAREVIVIDDSPIDVDSDSNTNDISNTDADNNAAQTAKTSDGQNNGKAIENGSTSKGKRKRDRNESQKRSRLVRPTRAKQVCEFF